MLPDECSENDATQPTTPPQDARFPRYYCWARPVGVRATEALLRKPGPDGVLLDADSRLKEASGLAFDLLVSSNAPPYNQRCPVLIDCSARAETERAIRFVQGDVAMLSAAVLAMTAFVLGQAPATGSEQLKEFALAQQLRNILAVEQEHAMDLKQALGK